MSNIEIIVKKLINIYVKDADVYVNNGSLWLIFTEEKKWVIELDNAGNLWYNYHFFYNIFNNFVKVLIIFRFANLHAAT